MAAERTAVIEDIDQGENDLGQHVAESFPMARVPDNLARPVYCVLGMPIDLIDMAAALSRIEAAIKTNTRLFISTANLNFLVMSLSNQEFRASLRRSDLCTVDGMPIVWIARLLGIPLKARVAGSDLFEALAARERSPVGVYFFGGAETVAASAAANFNARSRTATCVGSMFPGYGSSAEMSSDAVIDRLNASGAQVLVVALGALKGQQWLSHNFERLRIPVRTHLGAVINFWAGKVKRAPPFFRRSGLEWMWRIKEEPELWRRYWGDGLVLVRLLFGRVVPLAIGQWWHAFFAGRRASLLIDSKIEPRSVTLALIGAATAHNIRLAANQFRLAANLEKELFVLDFSEAQFIDMRFFGLLLMLQKDLQARRTGLYVTGVSPRIRRLFQLNGLDDFLSAPSRGGSCEMV